MYKALIENRLSLKTSLFDEGTKKVKIETASNNITIVNVALLINGLKLSTTFPDRKWLFFCR